MSYQFNHNFFIIILNIDAFLDIPTIDNLGNRNIANLTNKNIDETEQEIVFYNLRSKSTVFGENNPKLLTILTEFQNNSIFIRKQQIFAIKKFKNSFLVRQNVYWER